MFTRCWKKRVLALILVILPAAQAFTDEKGTDAPEGPKIGTKAPDFTLLDSSGQKRTLSDLQSKKQVALVFYPALFRSGG